jgi:uncharacterized membrane protein
MKRTSPLSAIAGLAGAALAMYYLDPQQGARRRALVRNQISARLVELNDGARLAAVDLRNRMQGTVGALRQRVSRAEVPDEVLAERVRSKLGRAVSHPGAIEVVAASGSVTLSGPILAHEHERALRAISSLPGAKEVIDRLDAHKEAGNISALQGGVPRDERIDIAQQHWAPATRLLAGLGGGALACYGLGRRSALRPLLLLGGLALVTRAATNLDAKRLLGQRGHRGIDFTKTMTIAAPVEVVFELWRNFEYFPKFMRNVRRVRQNADSTWHWEVAGPLGTNVQWDARITQLVPNERIAWASVPGSPVQHAGIVRFQPQLDGTRLQIDFTYNPPAGALGHVVASLFGTDAKTEMDEDLMRMKVFFETGKAARDAAQPLERTGL